MMHHEGSAPRSKTPSLRKSTRKKSKPTLYSDSDMLKQRQRTPLKKRSQSQGSSEQREKVTMRKRSRRRNQQLARRRVTAQQKAVQIKNMNIAQKKQAWAWIEEQIRNAAKRYENPDEKEKELLAAYKKWRYFQGTPIWGNSDFLLEPSGDSFAKTPYAHLVSLEKELPQLQHVLDMYYRPDGTAVPNSYSRPVANFKSTWASVLTQFKDDYNLLRRTATKDGWAPKAQDEGMEVVDTDTQDKVPDFPRPELYVVGVDPSEPSWPRLRERWAETGKSRDSAYYSEYEKDMKDWAQIIKKTFPEGIPQFGYYNDEQTKNVDRINKLTEVYIPSESMETDSDASEAELTQEEESKLIPGLNEDQASVIEREIRQFLANL